MRNIVPTSTISSNYFPYIRSVPSKLEILHDDDNSHSSITEPSITAVKFRQRLVDTSYTTITKTKRESIFRNTCKDTATTDPSYESLFQKQPTVFRNHSSSATTISESISPTDSLSEFLRTETMTSPSLDEDSKTPRRNYVSKHRQQEQPLNSRTKTVPISYYSFDNSITARGKIDTPSIPFFWRSHPIKGQDVIINKRTSSNNKGKETVHNEKDEVKVNLNLVSFIESYGWKFQDGPLCLYEV